MTVAISSFFREHRPEKSEPLFGDFVVCLWNRKMAVKCKPYQQDSRGRIFNQQARVFLHRENGNRTIHWNILNSIIITWRVNMKFTFSVCSFSEMKNGKCFIASDAIKTSSTCNSGMEHQGNSLNANKTSWKISLLSNEDASSIVTLIYCCYCLWNEFSPNKFPFFRAGERSEMKIFNLFMRRSNIKFYGSVINKGKRTV